jgi:uncharacterized protein YjbI with pentapeptide repeats
MTMLTTGWIVSFVGGRPGFEAEVRAQVLRALRTHGIEAQRMRVRDEDPWQPVDADAVPDHLDGPVPHMLTIEAAGVTLLLSLGHDPYLLLRVSAGAVEPDALLSCADALADACRPDLGWVFPSFNVDPPYRDQRASLAARMQAGAGRSPDFYDRGPAGLGVRTYFGPLAVQQISESALRTLPPPASLTRTSWGGLRVDLAADLTAADDDFILQAYESAMRALEPTGFFATASVTPSGIRFAPASWWTPGALGRGRDAKMPGPARSTNGAHPLEEAAAAGRTIEGANGRDLIAKGAQLAGLRVEGGDFTNADFAEARFDGAVLVDVDMDDAHIERATFRGAQLDQVGLRGAHAAHTSFKGAQIVSSFLEGAGLDDADFSGSQLQLSELSQVSARAARFVGATIVHTNFSGADLSGADFSCAHIDRCDFAGALLENVRWTDARITASTFDSENEPPGITR